MILCFIFIWRVPFLGGGVYFNWRKGYISVGGGGDVFVSNRRMGSIKFQLEEEVHLSKSPFMIRY